MSASYAVLIPARWGATRLPGKMLADIHGRPLIAWVVKRAQAAPGVTEVIVCTDDVRIAEAVTQHGGRAQMTRADHVSGTDRCAEVAAALRVDAVVNVQGDEPLIDPGDIAALAQAVLREGADIATLALPFEDEASRHSPHDVKALIDADGWALGFQRAWPEAERLDARVPEVAAVHHHIGVYAFARERLLAFAQLPAGRLETQERLEQLRALEAGWRIRVLPARVPALGVDTPADLERVRIRLAPHAPSAGSGDPPGG